MCRTGEITLIRRIFNQSVPDVKKKTFSRTEFHVNLFCSFIWGFPLNWTICVTCYSAILKSINGKTTFDHTLAGTVRTALWIGHVPLWTHKMPGASTFLNYPMTANKFTTFFCEVRHDSSTVVLHQIISEKGILSFRRGLGIAMIRDVSK